MDETYARIIKSLWAFTDHGERMELLPYILNSLAHDEAAALAKLLSDRFHGEIPW